jgi:hypothetical protein
MYKYNFIIIVGIIFISFIILYNSNIIEKLTNNDKNIILLGDSMLENSNYVNQTESIYYYLQTNKNNYNIYNYAKDESLIKNINTQLENIDVSFNNYNTYIFLSIGGNDILQNNFYIDNNYINKLFEKLQNIIKNIKKKLPNVNLYILNIYYPLSNRYKKYYDSIKIWNNLLEMNKKLGYKVIQTNKLMTSPKDFLYDIEPSAIGGKKIAEEILKSI